VPTIGFGPAEEHDAHVIDERLAVADLLAAARGYRHGIIAAAASLIRLSIPLSHETLFYYLSKALPPLVYPLGLAAILLLVAVFLLWRSRRWTTAALVLALALLWLGGNRIVMMAAVSSLEWRYTPPAELPQLDVIVVLGRRFSQPPALPRSTAELGDAGDRMLYAAYLHQQGVAPQLILSGGGVTGGWDSGLSRSQCDGCNCWRSWGCPRTR
jgi:hypothetical protein